MLSVTLDKDRVYRVNIIYMSKAENETDGIQIDQKSTFKMAIQKDSQ
jgi:hypothetical protein